MKVDMGVIVQPLDSPPTEWPAGRLVASMTRMPPTL